jgi:hypothetical protein
MPNRVPNPFDAPEMWETLVLVGSRGRTTIPGVADVSVRAGRPSIDQQEVPGSIGAVAYQIGWKLGGATCVIQTWNKADFDKLRALLEVYRRTPNAKVESIQALHPNLQMHNLTNVYLKSIEANDYNPDDGYVMTIELEEFTPDMRDQRTRQQFERLRAAEQARQSGGSSKAAGASGGAGGAPNTSGSNSRQPASTAQRANQNRPSQTPSLVQGVIDGSNTARGALGQ